MLSAELTLGLRNLYIIPSRFGALWLGSAALLLLVAIQTTSNSSLLLAFVMLALMLLAMFLTHDTLQGLRLRCGEPSPTFAAESATTPLSSKVAIDDHLFVCDSGRLPILRMCNFQLVSHW